MLGDTCELRRSSEAQSRILKLSSLPGPLMHNYCSVVNANAFLSEEVEIGGR